MKHLSTALIDTFLSSVNPSNLMISESKIASKTIAWTQLVQSEHAKYYGESSHGLILRDGASESELDALDLQMAFKFPPEFRELYSTHNGVGNTHGSEPNSINWSFVPISCIPELTVIARNWFEGTHADLAARFFPFFDWGCGDYTG
ncbi:MAG: SMI1/KNR4 family protein [Verrucomicrobia bacterium]|nr:SMI1/KNR4 family protein [Verrucomicrobiota bacterium]